MKLSINGQLFKFLDRYDGLPSKTANLCRVTRNTVIIFVACTIAGVGVGMSAWSFIHLLLMPFGIGMPLPTLMFALNYFSGSVVFLVLAEWAENRWRRWAAQKKYERRQQASKTFNLDTEEKEPPKISQIWHAFKNKYCPIIEWTDD